MVASLNSVVAPLDEQRRTVEKCPVGHFEKWLKRAQREAYHKAG